MPKQITTNAAKNALAYENEDLIHFMEKAKGEIPTIYYNISLDF